MLDDLALSTTWLRWGGLIAPGGIATTPLPPVAAAALTDASAGADDDLTDRVLVRVNLAATAAEARRASLSALATDDRSIADEIVVGAAASPAARPPKDPKAARTAKRPLALSCHRT